MQRRAFAILLGVAACGGPQTAQPEAPPRPPPAATVKDEPELPADQEMRAHFWDVAEARDAVINADLEAMRGPLLRIAEGQYGDDMPDDWKTWIGEMQNVAREGARVTSLEAAAQAVARLSGTCADCHRDTHAGPSLSEENWTPPPPPAGLGERMHQHMQASVALWEGLTAPQHQAWARGAQLLADLPLPAEMETEGEAEGAAPSPFAEKLAAIRGLGARAEAASNNLQKVAAYGAILQACSDCHAHVRNRAGG